MERAALVLALALLAADSVAGSEVAKVPVESFELANGMKFLAVVRPELATVSAGWVARVGSANERPGITGLSHLFEHMMFKGTHVIGTSDIAKDLKLMAQMDSVKAEIRKEEQAQIQRLRLGQISDLQ